MIALVLCILSAAGAISEPSIRMWTDSETVGVGAGFWIHIEATGTHFTLPDSIRVSGLSIDPINVRQASVSPSREQQDERTTKRSYFARAARPGRVLIPSMTVTIDGEEVTADSLELTVVSASASAEGPEAPATPTVGEVPKEDLVFIEMSVDQREIYQGEPIFFTTQLWRIIYPNIDSGPYRESRIEWPKTEGFFVHNLEPLSYSSYRSPWNYDVWEERMILFPTVVGEVQIGRWHWEGVALVDVRRRTRRQRLYYDLDTGPIPLRVKAVPPGPESYSGAVGTFECAVEFADTRFLQGLPTAVDVVVTGFGNPHAMGDPHWPAMNWAQVESRETTSESGFDETSGRLRVEKRYTYTLTPLARGSFRIEPVGFSYFDPDAEAFRDAVDGPFEVEVLGSAEGWQPMVVADSLPLDEGEIRVLVEDIRPLAKLDAVDVSRRRGPGAAVLAVTVLPVLGFILLAVVTRARRRVNTTVTPARAQRSAMERLDRAVDDDDPYDAIFQALSTTLALRVDGDLRGSTSDELLDALDRLGFDPALGARVRAVLQACDRARYGAGRSGNEAPDEALHKLVTEAKSCAAALEAHAATPMENRS